MGRIAQEEIERLKREVSGQRLAEGKRGGGASEAWGGAHGSVPVP